MKSALDYLAGSNGSDIESLEAAHLARESQEMMDAQEAAGLPVAEVDDGPHDDGVGEHPTELALARWMIQQHGQDMHHDVDRGAIRIWNGQIWRVDAKGQAHRWAKEAARRTAEIFDAEDTDQRTIDTAHRRAESAAGIGAILSLAKTEPGIPVTAAELDQHDFLLNAANGTLNLKTFKLQPFDRDDLLTKQIATPFDPAARAPLWESVLDRIMAGDGELIAYLQRLAGHSLTGDISVQEFWIFYGDGANGKSVFTETISGLMGDYAGVAPDSLLIARANSEHPTEIADLCGKRLVVASETEQAGKLRLQMIKKLTGDGVLKGRFMRQDYFPFRRTSKTILITNNKPRVSESTEAAWRRIRLIPFDVVIPAEERDDKLMMKLRKEWPGILAWMVRGCEDWQRNGMRPPAKVLAATSAYRDEADPLADYITDRLIVSEGLKVGRGDVWSDCQAWAVQIGEQGIDRNQFYERLRKIEGVGETAWKLAGSVVRGFTGIGLSWQGGSNGE